MPARVLVVDDLPANAKLLEAKLVREYFDVFPVADGESALEFARKDCGLVETAGKEAASMHGNGCDDLAVFDEFGAC